MGLSTCTKLQLFHCHVQEKTIDNRFPRNEIRIHWRINRKQLIIVYEKLFSLLSFGNYCRGTKSAGWPQTWKIVAQLSCSGKIWKYPGNLRGKRREFSLSKCGHPEKRWGSCQSPLPGKTLPLRFFLCCVKTVWCRKTKRSDLVSSMDNVDLPL